ncbi:LysR family transcriptional regulator [Levilactobacillus namurensis]|uniref:LysR family transcriptional regulator n=1 Tax=Levilactobacillus namurensis TaxID=380393 RepID=UPI0022323EFE|nr:LysR family transcriptional regulator [Levilactobacillus namurensis]MCW3779393.1 LysR family transcriptional regulator [Levilactobacillus namurensis]MDT7018186.1 LysR family transcriptional regulator [Levilactobacillus namurensis]WNN64827.1 LysR family transcriptional regulator [Levilactobacillus namurensis]
MIEPYLLEELVAFSQTGTLAKTAQQLHVTQPTVTRGMQKLEDDLGVQLFDRQPNRITLTATGRRAAKLATRLMAQHQAFSTQVQAFDHAQRVLTITATLPGPLLLARKIAQHTDQALSVTTTFSPSDQATDLLTTHQATLVLTQRELQTPVLESRYLGREKLAVNLDQFMYQANQTTVTFAELRGMSFLVLQDIGSWRDVIQREIPQAKFLYQTQPSAFREITTYSDFPYFSTNLSRFDPHVVTPTDHRVCRPIRDAVAQMPIYASYLKADRQRVAPVLAALRAHWPDD